MPTLKTREAREDAALERFEAYQRRWRLWPDFDNDRAIDLANAFVRRMKVLRPTYEPPTIERVGNMNHLLQWVPREGRS